MLRRLLAVVALVPIVALPARAEPSCNWPMYGHDPGHSFAQSADCSAFDLAGAARTIPKWFVHTRDSVSASPTVVDGVVYIGAWDGRFYAISAENGEELWHFDVDDDHEVAFGRIVSSAAVDAIVVPGIEEPQRVVLFGGGATLYALEHPTGRVLAQVDVDPRSEELKQAQASDPPQVEIESSPVVGHFPDGDRIFVGMDVHNRRGVGRTGLLSFGLRKNDEGPTPFRFELLYKFDPETGTVRHSLTDGSGTGWGCGGVWSSPALDVDALGGDGVVAFGTSNCDNPTESDAAGEIGREAMFAIVAKTGEELWRFQPRGVQDVDDDFGASPNMLPGGAVGEGGKDGWYYKRRLLDGGEVWSTRAGQSGHLGEGFALGGFIGTPAVGEANERATIFGTTAFPTPIGDNDFDSSVFEDPDRMFSIHAIDVETGEVVWRQRLAGPSYGAPTYADGLVFVPDTFMLQLQIVDANTGVLLRAIPLPGAPSSAPAIVGDSVYMGVGTRETDAEFKAFGDELQQLFESTVGAHPLSPLSGIAAFRIA